jgi:L-ribulose-5-phosphate 4-epimerase
MRAVLVAGHGPFCWGESPADAAHVAVVLEEVARMAYSAMVLNPSVQPISGALRDKHFLRKHGPDAYYGQKGNS